MLPCDLFCNETGRINFEFLRRSNGSSGRSLIILLIRFRHRFTLVVLNVVPRVAVCGSPSQGQMLGKFRGFRLYGFGIFTSLVKSRPSKGTVPRYKGLCTHGENEISIAQSAIGFYASSPTCIRIRKR